MGLVDGEQGDRQRRQFIDEPPAPGEYQIGSIAMAKTVEPDSAAEEAGIQDGDVITIDIPNRSLELHVPEQEIEERLSTWQRPPLRIKRGYLALYAQLAESADKGAIIRAHDPEGIDEARNLLPSSILYFDSIYEAIHEADAVVLMTEWNEYRGLDLEKVKETMKGDVFVDLRNVYEPDTMRQKGFDYTSVGR